MKRIAVLRGGPSEEYDVSMLTGKSVLQALDLLDFEPKDITITKSGKWLHNGFELPPEKALGAIDVVFIALHGQYGEDGQVQRILERLCIPYVGTTALASGIAFNKELTKQSLFGHDVKLPRHRKMTKLEMPISEDEISLIFKEVGSELFIKPVAGGSSVGAAYVPNNETLRATLDSLFLNHDQIMIEEFVRGKEATVGVLENFRNEKHYALPVIEIIPPDGKPLFSYEDKYNGTTEEIVPGRFSYYEKTQLSDLAKKIHQVIGCRHYSRSDFILRDGDIYFLEVNTLPGLTPESLFPKATEAVGISIPRV